MEIEIMEHLGDNYYIANCDVTDTEVGMCDSLIVEKTEKGEYQFICWWNPANWLNSVDL